LIVIALVAERKAEIAALCKRHGIVRLELFGSAATGKFDPETSDLDFIIDLGKYDAHIARRFIDFANDMERLFGRPVDLLMYGPIKNPYLKMSVDRARELIFAAQDSEAAA
jgi:predicted nucleotidyltransferase